MLQVGCERASNQENDMKSGRTLPNAQRGVSGARKRGTRQGDDDHVYRVIEIVGTSEKSISGAIDGAITRAHKTLRNLRWFEVDRISGHIDSGKVRHYQVTLSVGFTMEEPG
jgi:flavin-binding protein dodecin